MSFCRTCVEDISTGEVTESPATSATLTSRKIRQPMGRGIRRSLSLETEHTDTLKQEHTNRRIMSTHSHYFCSAFIIMCFDDIRTYNVAFQMICRCPHQ